MNAVLLPVGGKVWVDGMDTSDEDLLLEVRRRVGMVFQNPDNQIVANVAGCPSPPPGPPWRLRPCGG